MASELKPCPFCGSNRIAFRSTPDMDTDGKFHSISCNECGAGSREKFAMETCPLFYEELRNAWNTRPTPVRCDELKTEKWEAFIVGDWLQISGEQAAWKHSKVRELVTRQNAEEVIAAERLKLEATARVGLQLSEKIEALEADNASLIHDLNRIKDHETELVNDNAAKDARITELEEHFAEMTRSCLAERDRNKVLEADNERLREALEPFADVLSRYTFTEHQIILLSEDNPTGRRLNHLSPDVFGRARAALGEVKP